MLAATDAGAREGGKVQFKSDRMEVSIVLGGPVAVGRINYSMPSCRDSVRFTTEIQPPDPAGGPLPGIAENCQDQKLGVDVSPEAFIDGDGKGSESADFSARLKPAT